ncbi:MAG: GNAT family N-acetyltransferase [Candidatus Kapaibacterium sp.]
MIEIKEIHNENEFPKGVSREDFIDFLYVHLDQFGDTKRAIGKCLDYAFEKDGGQGGFALAALEDGKLIGALIMNKTGMEEYIPPNILVYVAVHESTRGKGIGGQLCKKAIEMAEGDVKLHVEYENPAKRLYERLGFTTKYAEMRYVK